MKFKHFQAPVLFSSTFKDAWEPCLTHDENNTRTHAPVLRVTLYSFSWVVDFICTIQSGLKPSAQLNTRWNGKTCPLATVSEIRRLYHYYTFARNDFLNSCSDKIDNKVVIKGVVTR